MMPTNKPSGSLLETLRAQSDAVRGQGDAARRPVEESLVEIDRRLWAPRASLVQLRGRPAVAKHRVDHTP